MLQLSLNLNEPLFPMDEFQVGLGIATASQYEGVLLKSEVQASVRRTGLAFENVVGFSCRYAPQDQAGTYHELFFYKVLLLVLELWVFLKSLQIELQVGLAGDEHHLLEAIGLVLNIGDHE